MIFGPTYKCHVSPMVLADSTVEWVDSIKYLDVVLMAAKTFSINFDQVRYKKFSATNAIFSHCHGANDLVRLHLAESYCLPVLPYAIECMNLKSPILGQLNSYWNSVFRKIFCYKKHESVKEFICRFGRMKFILSFISRGSCVF